MIRTIAAIATLALSLSAVGQQSRTYCSGAIVGDGFSDTVTARGGTSTVVYSGTFRNTTNGPIHATIRLAVPDAKPALILDARADHDIPPHGAVRVRLGTQTFDNPTGAGKLSPSSVQHGSIAQCRITR